MGRDAFDEFQAPFQRGQPPCDGACDFGQMPNGRDQHQHGGDEGHKIAHGHATAAALPQRHGDHGGQSHGGQHLGQGRHGRLGDGGLQRQPAQADAQAIKPLPLTRLSAVQAHHAVGQRVFFHHIGQFIGGLLAGTGQPVEALGQRAHDKDQRWKQEEDDECELPVQVHQVAQQGHQGQAVLGQAQQCVDQHGGPGLDLVHQGVGELAGALLGKQVQLCIVEPLEHGAAQVQQAEAGRVRQCVLRHKASQAPKAEEGQQGCRHHPEVDIALAEAAVEQSLEQGRDQWLGQRTDHRADSGQHDAQFGRPEIGPELAQPLGDAAGRGVGLGGSGGQNSLRCR